MIDGNPAVGWSGRRQDDSRFGNATDVARYLHLLVNLLIVRRVPACHRNFGKHLVKAMKVFFVYSDKERFPLNADTIAI
ncbi:MAG TPA: hypothetical protein VK731_03940 [Candidatus Cybelea sp.]|nr:hypothetical protein [Candidatus Cybelea sp.]